ncbi:MAG: molybdopterin-binding protein [Geminicoccaceae bacterium]
MATDGEQKKGKVTAGLLIIGNEILSGRTVDANLPYLATFLGGIGIRLVEARVIPDIEREIVDAVNAMRVKVDYLFTTGGIGPTHDDITARCIAKAFGLGFGRHPEAERRLRAFYPPEKLTEARLKMAETPAGATLIDNPVSVAPGFIVENVHVLAGVPKIMQAMLDILQPRLVGGALVQSRTLVVFKGEGDMAAALGAIQDRYPAIDIGSYPFFRMDKPGTSIVFRGDDVPAIDAAFAELEAYCRASGVECREEVLLA